MKRDLPQRKHPVHLPNKERHNQPVIVFLTVCTSDRKEILGDEEMHTLIRDSWIESKEWKVGKYIIMPDHIHLFCSPSSINSENINKWAAFWKRYVSRNKQELQPIWQRSCWDTQLRDVNKYDEKWKYVELNPVRKGLVDTPGDWPYQGTLNELRW